MKDQLPRTLAAILYADVAGYSRLTGNDEDGTHVTLSGYLDFIADCVTSHRGTVMHYAGDAVLARFGAVSDAMGCSTAIQTELRKRSHGLAEQEKVQFRIGVNLGDVIEDRGEIYGNGVNVAARLESLAEPGGICVSESVRSALSGRQEYDYRDLGPQKVKNIEEPVRAYRVTLRTSRETRPTVDITRQQVNFHVTPDGISLAYSRIGEGPVLVKAANWVNHLEHEVTHPPWRAWWQSLAEDYELIRYDQRGNGLSDRDVDDVSIDSFVDDLESLTDALGLERFALLGISQGCGVSVAYAVRHPERVSHLVLYGGYVRGWLNRGDAEAVAQGEALTTLIRQGWGEDNPVYRQMFAAMFRPDATLEESISFSEQCRTAVSPEGAVRFHEAFGMVDVESILPQVSTPTLVLHCRDDARAPFDQGRTFAARIPGARFVPLDGRNHILAPGDACWERFFNEIRSFLKPGEE